MHFSQSKSTKCEIFAWNCDFSGTAYAETQNLWHWIWHALNPNTCHSSHLDAFFPVKINKKWNFGCFLNSPWQKMKNKFNLNREKVFQKACKSAHVGFWVCQLQCTMLELCVTSTFWVIMVFLHFTGRSRYRVLKHGVGVKWDPRRTAAYVPSHFNSF